MCLNTIMPELSKLMAQILLVPDPLWMMKMLMAGAAIMLIGVLLGAVLKGKR